MPFGQKATFGGQIDIHIMMKHILTLLACCTTISAVVAQNFSFIPTKPQADDQVMISYDATGGPLENKEWVATAYLLRHNQEPVALSVPFAWKGDKHLGTFRTNEDTEAILVSIRSTDSQTQDNNNGDGYTSIIYKRDAPQKSGNLALAEAFLGSYTRVLGLDRTPPMAQKHWQQELNLNPKAQKYLANLPLRAAIASEMKDEAEVQAVTAMLQKLSSKKMKDEQSVILLRTAKSLKNDELSESILAKAIEQYPKGELATNELITEYYKSDLDRKGEILQTLRSRWNKKDDQKSTLDNLSRRLALEYADAEDWAKAKRYLRAIANPNTKASALNNLAWSLSGESLEAEPKDLKMGLEFSKESLELINSEITAVRFKDDYVTKESYVERAKGTYAMYSDTYALLLAHDEQYDEAKKYQKIAVEKYDFSDGQMNERYAMYMVKSGDHMNALDFIESRIAAGDASAQMKDEYKRLFVENLTLDQAADKIVSTLEKSALEKKKAEILESMSDEDAPAFSLLNMEGEEISQDDLLGKIVVLDFWATWCGPCVASFPGMQEAQNKFADRDDVAFVFVNTWENSDDKVNNAKNFLMEKGYDFDVLMDEKNTLVADYGVKGIPTKFFLDKEGKIRYQSVGYSGSNEELVNEISLIIEVLDDTETRP